MEPRSMHVSPIFNHKILEIHWGKSKRERKKCELKGNSIWFFHLVSLHCGSAQRLYSRKATSPFHLPDLYFVSLFARICFIRIRNPAKVSPLFMHSPPSWMKYECHTFSTLAYVYNKNVHFRALPRPTGPGKKQSYTKKFSSMNRTNGKS